MTLIYLVAGEASGDTLGARLIAALRARRPDLRFAGIGGPLMAQAGLESLFPMQDLALMGLVEVLPKLRLLRRRLRETQADIAARQPALLVTIDSPGFALRLLRAIPPSPTLRRVHYVAPQIWAWREGRARHYHGLWDDLLCLLPFEPAIFARHNLPAHFVGHPVLESGADQGDGPAFRARHAIAPDAPVLLLLPGSRRGEITRLLPIYQAALALLRASLPDLVPVLIAAPAMAEVLRAASAHWPIQPLLVDQPGEKYDAYAAATAALCKSGTATLELAVAGVPMAVAYRVNPLTAAIARRLLRVPYVSILNLLAGRELVPELLQQSCRPDLLAATLLALLTDGAAAGQQRAAFAEVLGQLQAPISPPSAAAAEAVLARLEQYDVRWNHLTS